MKNNWKGKEEIVKIHEMKIKFTTAESVFQIKD